MGCYESFTADVICTCGNKFKSDDIQSKDFDCALDHIKQGEDTREYKCSYFLHADGVLTQKVEGLPHTLEEAIAFQKENSNEYLLHIWHYETEPFVLWGIYKFLGHRPTVFYGIKDMEFDCYTTCPKCKKWLDLKGIIKDYVFIGVQPA